MSSQEQEQEAAQLQQERDALIAKLEARERTPRGLGVRAPVALMGILLSVVLLWQERRDIAYLFAPREPLTLGTEGDYHFENLVSNRYAQVHGTPTTRAAFGQHDGQTVVMVGLQDTPLVVRRAPLPGEEWTPGRPPPPPHQAPFGVRGRLLREDEDPAFAQGFASLRQSEQLRPRDGKLWVLVEGARPGADAWAATVALVLTVLLLFNVWLLFKALTTSAARRKTA